MMGRNFFLLIILLGIFLLDSGCATIIHGTTQDIPVNTKPDGCKAKTADGQECVTPCQLTLKRKNDHVVQISKDGFESTSVNLQHVVSGAVAGNIIAGGLIGWGVDAVSGGQYRLVPEIVSVELKPVVVQMEKPGLTVEKLKELEELRKAGALTEEEYGRLKSKLLGEFEKKQ